MKIFPAAALAVAVLAGATSSASATATRTISGAYGDLQWQAESLIVGVNSTATLAAGGNPIYFAPMPQYSGVASLIMDFGGGNQFICSGALLPDRRSILTAAHCVTDGSMNLPLSTTAFFYGGPNPDTRVHTSPASTAVAVSQTFVHASYTGDVIDQNDIAVLRLATDAPAFATSYSLYGGSDLTSTNFNVAGYGRRSDTGGSVGANLNPGILRQGDNRYDFRFGDPDFLGLWSVILGEPASQIEFSYVSDFDNGQPSQDASCRIAGVFALGGPKYCDLGVGVMEVAIASGDSGGPGFVGGQLASINSYGLTFGRAFGDVDNRLNSSFGEFSGYVPVHIHRDFIQAVMIPEPSTYALMLLGLAMLGFSAKRRRKA